MTILGSQCASCPTVAWLQTNAIDSGVPDPKPLTPTSYNASVFPQLVIDEYNNSLLMYINQTGGAWSFASIVIGSHGVSEETFGTDYNVSGNPGPDLTGTLATADITLGYESIQVYDNGVLRSVYNGTGWDYYFISVCCPDATVTVPSGAFTDPEDPLNVSGELSAYLSGLGTAADGTGTQVVYTTPLGEYYHWVVDLDGNPILDEKPTSYMAAYTDSANSSSVFSGPDLTAPTNGSNGLTTKQQMVVEEWRDVTWLFVSDDEGASWDIASKFEKPLRGIEDQGTISALPAGVTTAFKSHYIWDVNTTSGDIDLSSLGVLTNVMNGSILVFRNTGDNNLLYDQDINGSTVTYVAQGQGDSISLAWDAGNTNYQVV